MATVFIELGGGPKVPGGELCSGVVIGDNRVLTAAHCFNECTLPSCSIVVGFGNSTDDKGVIRIHADRVLVYPGYSSPGALPGRDLAVLVLKDGHENLDPGYRQAAKVLLASRFMELNPKALRIVGYGYSTLTDLSRYGVAGQATVNVESSTCVEPSAIQTGCAAFQEFILSNAPEPGTATLHTHDTCYGDSGGPAMLVADKPPRILVGITSRSVNVSDADLKCGPGGIYELVGTIPVLQWLQAAVPDLTITVIEQ